MINTEPLITTVIPTFRRPKLLRRAIESALGQTYPRLRVSVHDNASGDETEATVAEYAKRDPRVSYSRNESNIGAVANMVQGASAVSTAYYSLLNDDDFLLPSFYEQALSQFEAYPQAMFACASAICVDGERRQVRRRNKDWPAGFYAPSIESASHMYRSHFAQPGVLIRKDLRQLIGVFEPSGDDRLYMAMAAAACGFVVLGEAGAVYVHHSASYSATVGLRNTELSAVYEQLLATIGTILRIELPVERKVHLLMLALNAYGWTFDDRGLTELFQGMSGSPGSIASVVPSRVTHPGLVIEMFRRVSPRLHPLVAKPLSAARRVRHFVAQARSAGISEPLADDLCRLLESGDPDASNRFAELVR